uniref:Uncharacterized protein n=1 Tax=Arundo donax TaxID=35708 RepID=A0A0A9BSL7_ARUDO
MLHNQYYDFPHYSYV